MQFYEPLTIEEARALIEYLEYSSNHNHTEVSNFRLRDCIIKIPHLIDRALELNYKGVCCTDHEALTAHVRILRRFKELKSLYNEWQQCLKDGKELSKDVKANLHLLKNFDGFKVGLGNEIYLVDSLEEVKDNYVSGETKFYHFILIAKDKIGYEQLEKISSESAWKNWYKQGRMERVPTIKSEMEEIIGDNKGHLIAQTACAGGELSNLILKYLNTKDNYYKKEIHKFITWCVNLFGKENFFLEIQPCVIKKDENGNNIPHEQAIINQFMFTLADAYKLDILCTTDSHYLKKEDRFVHEAYLKADDDEKSSNREVGDFYETTYMFEKAELAQTLSTHLTPEQIKRTFEGSMKALNMIEEYDLSHPTIVPTDKKLPKFKLRHVLKDWYNKYEYIRDYAESDNIQDQYLLYLIENGLDNLKQWGDSTWHFATYDENGGVIEEYDKTVKQEEKIARINEELSSFWKISEKLKQPLSAYYVLVRGLIHEVIWKYSYCGIGRGSSGGSYICYLIEITQINPMKYDLPFWRHSSPLRPELPD